MPIPCAKGRITGIWGKYLDGALNYMSSFLHSTSLPNHIILHRPSSSYAAGLVKATQRRLLQAQFSPKGHVSGTARQRWASTEVIRRACSQERWHLFNIPCGLSSCSMDMWQEPYLHFWSKFIPSIVPETGVITFKRSGRKTNYCTWLRGFLTSIWHS